jgi:hypothetical protein
LKFIQTLWAVLPFAHAAHSHWLSQSEIVLPAAGPPKPMISKFVRQCKLSVPWMVASFLAIWPIACIVCYSLYGHSGYNDYPIPQWSSAIVGGVCALITCPFWAIISMVRVGELMGNANDSELETANGEPM